MWHKNEIDSRFFSSQWRTRALYLVRRTTSTTKRCGSLGCHHQVHHLSLMVTHSNGITIGTSTITDPSPQRPRVIQRQKQQQRLSQRRPKHHRSKLHHHQDPDRSRATSAVTSLMWIGRTISTKAVRRTPTIKLALPRSPASPARRTTSIRRRSMTNESSEWNSPANNGARRESLRELTFKSAVYSSFTCDIDALYVKSFNTCVLFSLKFTQLHEFHS